MDRQYYLALAARGLKMPIGTDLVVHEKPDAPALMRDGPRLGRVFEEAARRYRTPLAVPQMDLTLEKSAMLGMLGIPAEARDTWHFAAAPTDEMMQTVQQRLSDPPDERLAANLTAVRYIATETDLLPVGMSIGPFSLMTKLLAEPITPVYMAAAGASAADEPEVAMVERALALSIQIILRSINAQVDAGAKAIFIAEPAANKAFISPMQLDAGSDIFDRYVMGYNQQIRSLLRDRGVDLVFHCCGELTEYMVRKFAALDPAILSLGSSRKLWEDASLVPNSTVLFGNLPTKKFYDDKLVSVADARRLSRELLDRMAATGHPFILGSECDVLSVPGCEHTIKAKVAAMLE